MLISSRRRSVRGGMRAGFVLAVVLAGIVLSATGATVSHAAKPSPKPVTISAAAIKKNWPSVVAEAKQEKTVIFYTLSQSTASSIAAGFEKTYPWANVQSIVGAPGDIASRLVTEAKANAPTADVIQLPGSQRQTLLTSNIVAPTEVPWDTTMTKTFVDPTYYAHPVYISPIGIVYNTNLLKASDLPTDIYQFANPKWKGKIAFDRPQNQALAAIFLAGPRKEWGDAKWRTWLNGLQANSIQVEADATSAYQAALRGDAEIAFDSPGDVLAQPAGTPMALAFYKNIIWYAQYVWLARRAQHPAMAKLLINWLMSPVGERVWAASGRSPANLTSTDTPVSLSKIIPSNFSLLPANQLSGFFDNPTPVMNILDALWPS